MSKTIWSRTKNQGAPRLGYSEYGISRERLCELQHGCVTGAYPSELLSRACAGFKFIESWILLSVMKGCSYDAMIIKWELKVIKRPPAGRSDFYGYRRRFYYNLDCLLRAERGNASVKERGKG